MRCSRLLHMSIKFGSKRAAASGGAADARKPFDARVPQQDRGLAVDKHDAVVHVVDQFLFEERRGGESLPAALVRGVRARRRSTARRCLRSAGDAASGGPVSRSAGSDRARISLGTAAPTSGSNWRPANSNSSASARSRDRAGRYNWSVVIESNASTIDKHSRGQRQIVALAILMAPVAVIPGAAVVNDFEERLRRAAAGEHFHRVRRMARHQDAFFGRQPAGLQQNSYPARRSCRRRAAARRLPAGREFRRPAAEWRPRSCSPARPAMSAKPFGDAWPAVRHAIRWPYRAGPALTLFRVRWRASRPATDRSRLPPRPTS